jgi:hypothetical protein
MLQPYVSGYKPDATILREVAYYWRLVLGGANRGTVQSQLPEIMPAWGKVRIDEGRTIIRASMLNEKRPGYAQRLASFVRVCFQYLQGCWHLLIHPTSMKVSTQQRRKKR